MQRERERENKNEEKRKNTKKLCKQYNNNPFPMSVCVCVPCTCTCHSIFSIDFLFYCFCRLPFAVCCFFEYNSHLTKIAFKNHVHFAFSRMEIWKLYCANEMQNDVRLGFEYVQKLTGTASKRTQRNRMHGSCTYGIREIHLDIMKTANAK